MLGHVLLALLLAPPPASETHGPLSGLGAGHPPLPASPSGPLPTSPSGLEEGTPFIWSVPVLHGAALLGGMRLSVSLLWPDFYDPFAFSRNAAQFRRAYAEPPEFRSERSLLESDGDPGPLNVVGHGLFGSEVYARTRGCGGGVLAGLIMTTAVSAVWEYGLEAFHKRPSALDLVLTPVLGAAIGEARHRVHRWAGRRPTVGRRILQVVVDPFGEAERRWLQTRC